MALAGLEDILEQLANSVRDTLADVLADVNLEVQVEPAYVLEPTPLTVDMYPADEPRDPDTEALGGEEGAHMITVRARIGTADFDASYAMLIRMMDDTNPLCLAAAVTNDPTLDGYAADVYVRSRTGLQAYEHISGAGAHLGFGLKVLVIPAHT